MGFQLDNIFKILSGFSFLNLALMHQENMSESLAWRFASNKAVACIVCYLFCGVVDHDVG